MINESQSDSENGIKKNVTSCFSSFFNAQLKEVKCIY